MEAVRLFHLAVRCLLILIEAGGLLWLFAMLLASLGWLAWWASILLGRIRGAAEKARSVPADTSPAFARGVRPARAGARARSAPRR